MSRITVLVAGAFAALNVSQQAAAAPAVTAQMDCARFEWVAVGDRPRAAMVVTAMLNGKSFDFQFDTGAESSFIPEEMAVEAGLMKKGDGGARVQDVRLGGTSLGPRWMLSGRSTATIGLDMLVGYTTVIDYPAQRLCMTPTADLPFAIYRKTKWTDAILRNGKLFVPLSIDGKPRLDFFFDTGASLFPLSVDRDLFDVITDKRETQVISGSAWGNAVELKGAATVGPVGIASLPPAPATAFYSTNKPQRFAGYDFPAAGLFGNALLWDRTVVLTLGPRPQFGIVAD